MGLCLLACLLVICSDPLANNCLNGTVLVTVDIGQEWWYVEVLCSRQAGDVGMLNKGLESCY